MSSPTPKQLKNRRILVAALRDRSKWPKGFEWDFRSCRTCAMGLAKELYLATGNYSRSVADALGVNRRDALFVFTEEDIEGAIVTPEMVADRLEKLFAEEGGG